MPVTVCSRAGTSLLYTRPRSLARVLLDPAGPPNRQRVFASLSLSPSLSLSVAQPAPSLPPPRRSLARSLAPPLPPRPPAALHRHTDPPLSLSPVLLLSPARLVSTDPCCRSCQQRKAKTGQWALLLAAEPLFHSPSSMRREGGEGRGEEEATRTTSWDRVPSCWLAEASNQNCCYSFAVFGGFSFTPQPFALHTGNFKGGGGGERGSGVQLGDRRLFLLFPSFSFVYEFSISEKFILVVFLFFFFFSPRATF